METQIPASISAGTTVEYFRNFADYPVADGWGLTLYIAGREVFQKPATTEGDLFKVTLTAAETARLAAGTYRWVERATKSGVVKDAASGSVDVTLNLATAAAGEARSRAEILLELVDAKIQGRITRDMESYTIEGTTISKAPLETLIRWRSTLAAQVESERNPGTFSRPVEFRFTRPGCQ